jgi:prepilin peptidase CpaA
MSEIVIAIVGCGGAAIAAIDLRTRRIPNGATAALAVAGFALAATGLSGRTPAGAMVGLVLGFLLMLPGHLLGGTGAGDVKLFAAMGTLLGPGAIAHAFLYTAIAGGILAFLVAVRRRRLADTVTGVAAMVGTRGSNAADIEAPTRHNRFAYAPAIAVGTLVAALGV